MAKPIPTPLSPTVQSVFEEFLKKLQDQKTLDDKTIEKLRNALDLQKFDPESLRSVIFDEIAEKAE